MPVLVEAGRAAIPEPLVETLAGVALLSAAGGEVADLWLERVAGGGGLKGAWRVLLWGSLAQAATALIGHAFGVSAG